MLKLSSTVGVELEHAIGLAGHVPGSVAVLDGSRFLTVAGAIAMVNTVTDPHDQTALRGHRSHISALAVSPSGRLVATADRNFDCDVCVWDLQPPSGGPPSILYRIQEHDHGVRSISFSHDERLLLTIGDELDGVFIITDLATGMLVSRQPQDPLPTICSTWGGFARDIKGRETLLYLFATGGSKALSLWTLDPTTGECAHERPVLSSTVMRDVARDYCSLAFSPGPDRAWLYAGTSTGEIVVIHARTMAVHHSLFVASGGIFSIAATMLLSASHADSTMNGLKTHGQRMSRLNAGIEMGSSLRNPSLEDGVDLVIGSGDGIVSIVHHATGQLQNDLVLHAPVSAAQNYGATRPNLASKSLFITRQTKIEGAVYSVSLFPRSNGSPNSYGFLAGTSSGALYRLYKPDGPNLGSTIESKSTTESGLVSEKIRQSHASMSEPFNPDAAPSLAMAGNPGVNQLPMPLQANRLIVGNVVDVSFSPNASDRFVSIGTDNTVRLWDLSDYSCVSSALVRSAGHPNCVVHADEFHLSGWQDGVLRCYFSEPVAVVENSTRSARDTSSSAAMLVAGASSTFVGASNFPLHGLGGAGAGGSPGRKARRTVGGAGTATAGGGTAMSGGIAASASGGGHEAAGFLWLVPEAHSSKSGGVTALGLAHNLRYCATGGGDAKVRVWDIRTREMVSAFSEHGAQVTSLAIYKDDAHMITGSRDKSFICWDLRKETRISQHMQRAGGLHAVAISRDQSLVLTCGQERKLQAWDLREPGPVLSIAPVHGTEAEALTLGVSHYLSDLVVTGGSDGGVRVWDLRKTAHPVADLIGHAGAVKKVVWSPDDKQLVSCGVDGQILLWNVFAM